MKRITLNQIKQIQTKQSDSNMMTGRVKFVSFLSTIDRIILSNLQDIVDAVDKTDNKIDKICESFKEQR